MQITEIRVDAQWLISDGAYGNERVTVGYTVQLSDGDDAREIVPRLLVQAGEQVLARLKQSPREGIRFALETPEEREARYARENREREACYAREKAERAWRSARSATARLPGDAAEEEPDEDEESPF